MDMKFNMQFKFQCPEMKLYWNPPMLMGLCIVYGCFPATMAELSNYDTL